MTLMTTDRIGLLSVLLPLHILRKEMESIQRVADDKDIFQHLLGLVSNLWLKKLNFMVQMFRGQNCLWNTSYDKLHEV